MKISMICITKKQINILSNKKQSINIEICQIIEYDRQKIKKAQLRYKIVQQINNNLMKQTTNEDDITPWDNFNQHQYPHKHRYPKINTYSNKNKSTANIKSPQALQSMINRIIFNKQKRKINSNNKLIHLSLSEIKSPHKKQNQLSKKKLSDHSTFKIDIKKAINLHKSNNQHKISNDFWPKPQVRFKNIDKFLAKNAEESDIFKKIYEIQHYSHRQHVYLPRISLKIQGF